MSFSFEKIFYLFIIIIIIIIIIYLGLGSMQVGWTASDGFIGPCSPLNGENAVDSGRFFSEVCVIIGLNRVEKIGIRIRFQKNDVY